MESDLEPTDMSVKDIADVINKIKKNKDLVPQTIDMLRRNPDMERDATNMALDMEGMKNTTVGMETPLKERKKMIARQQLVKSQIKHRLKDGEVKCVSMLLNGKLSPYAINCVEAENNEKYKTGAVTIQGKDYMYILTTTLRPSKNNLNKRASVLLLQPVYGIVHFVLIDEEFDPVDSSIEDFPK